MIQKCPVDRNHSNVRITILHTSLVKDHRMDHRNPTWIVRDSNLLISSFRCTMKRVSWVESKKKKGKQITKIFEITSVRQTTRETLETIPRYVDETDRHQQGKDK
mgnify:CR=1 FL=1